ncbi:MAG TPA: ATP synthase F0 subunit B, partial [Clostridiales bacterium]|nr:ATP synthase F0 subunit B [Clostridiales bacterium]
EMKRQIIEIATLMAERFVQLSIDRETQDRLIAEALAEWEES